MTVTSNLREGSALLGIGRRATFLLSYAVVAALIVLALRALTRASDVLDNTPNIDEAHIVSRLSYIWIASAVVAACIVLINHLKWFRAASRWLLVQLAGVLLIAIASVIWAKQTPQQQVRLLHVGDQAYVVPRAFDPRRGEQNGKRFMDVALCPANSGQEFLGIYEPDCTRPSDSIPLVLRPFDVIVASGIESDLDRLKIPHLSGKILDVPNAIDIDKFSLDGYRGFSFRNIYLHHIIMSQDGAVLLHASCDSKQDRCTITRHTPLGSLSFEIAGDGTLELELWKATAQRYVELLKSWQCSNGDCSNLAAAIARP